VHLSAAEAQTIIAQAATQAQALGLPVTIAVLDHEGTVLGVLRMANARADITTNGGGTAGQGLEGATITTLPNGTTGAAAAAISKAGTAAFFSTQGNAFTTRSASFIIQEHFPPQVNPSPGGPLYGVQLSQLQCSDVSRTAPHSANTANLPLGLSGDPGGLPLYKNGTAVGGIGIEGDGVYTIDRDASSTAPTTEEIIAAAGTLGFSAPAGIRGNTILIDGVAIPFANAEPPPSLTTIPFATFVANGGTLLSPVIDSPPTTFVPMTVRGISGTVDPKFWPPLNSTDGLLTAADVTQIIGQAAVQAETTRAAIRNPLGSPARVSITVVDTNGAILGIFRTTDAPLFGFDVSAQKARTANFFTRAQAGVELRAAAGVSAQNIPVPLPGYATILANEGISLNGSLALTSRTFGFMSQPIYPPGATFPPTVGPLSKPLGVWSVFNTGLQSDALNLPNVLSATTPCALVGPGPLGRVPNGFQTFPGSVPLFKTGTHVGAIGVSGDGVDQDDFIAAAGSANFEAQAGIRADNIFVREARLPYVVFPRNPTLN
jgi:uncharacterized protein GlcG (DUF336 family)